MSSSGRAFLPWLMVAIWIGCELGVNALLAMAYEPRGSLVLPFTVILAANMVVTVAGWEMACGRAFFLTKKPKPPPTLPKTLFVRRMHDERGDWFSAWSEAKLGGQEVGVYRLKAMRTSHANL